MLFSQSRRLNCLANIYVRVAKFSPEESQFSIRNSVIENTEWAFASSAGTRPLVHLNPTTPRHAPDCFRLCPQDAKYTTVEMTQSQSPYLLINPQNITLGSVLFQSHCATDAVWKEFVKREDEKHSGSCSKFCLCSLPEESATHYWMVCRFISSAEKSDSHSVCKPDTGGSRLNRTRIIRNPSYFKFFQRLWKYAYLYNVKNHALFEYT